MFYFLSVFIFYLLSVFKLHLSSLQLNCESLPTSSSVPWLMLLVNGKQQCQRRQQRTTKTRTKTKKTTKPERDHAAVSPVHSQKATSHRQCPAL